MINFYDVSHERSESQVEIKFLWFYDSNIFQPTLNIIVNKLETQLTGVSRENEKGGNSTINKMEQLTKVPIIWISYFWSEQHKHEASPHHSPYSSAATMTKH